MNDIEKAIETLKKENFITRNGKMNVEISMKGDKYDIFK